MLNYIGLFILGVNILSILYGPINVPMAFKELINKHRRDKFILVG